MLYNKCWSLLIEKCKRTAFAHFPNMEGCTSAMRSCCLCCTCFTWIVTGVVFLVHHRCGLLPQPLDCICNISDALDSTALALTQWYNLVSQSSHCWSSHLSSARFESSSTTRQVQELNGSLRVVGRWCGRLRYVRCDVALDLLGLTLISS